RVAGAVRVGAGRSLVLARQSADRTAGGAGLPGRDAGAQPRAARAGAAFAARRDPQLPPAQRGCRGARPARRAPAMSLLPLVSDRAPDDVLAWTPQGPVS